MFKSCVWKRFLFCFWSSVCVQPTFSLYSYSDSPSELSCCHRVCWHYSAEYIQLSQSAWSLASQSNMNRYTFAELSDVHLVYGEARGNGREAQRIHQKRYPQRQLPHHTTFASIDTRLREYGTLEIKTRTAGRSRTVRTRNLEEAMLDTVEGKPFSSTRTTASDLSPLTLTFCCISYRAVAHKGTVSGHMFIWTFLQVLLCRTPQSILSVKFWNIL
jgi:hypothetical protein